MNNIINALQNNTPNAILPFLWVHGEEEATLRAEVRRIHACGIGALCVEARPHKDFGGPGWFGDLGIILEECKALGMQMWVLDDSHFPTGYADGAVQKHHPEKRKKYLCNKTMDFIGPQRHAAAILKYALRGADDEILAVTLSRKTDFETIDPATTRNITAAIHWEEDYNTGKPNHAPFGQPLPGVQGLCPLVDFDLEPGAWSLNVLTVSYHGGEKETEGYLNPLDASATQILLDTVYQPIYDRYKEDFGKTFAGFFSDEPRLGNLHGAEHASIGRNSAMNLPWCAALPALLEQRLQNTTLADHDLSTLLPLLFIDGSEGAGATAAHTLRCAYMDVVSTLYSENFDGVLANWCHAHRCAHIGHTIEDNNATARLGYGCGHFFRAMAHQDMAGIDVVIHQLTPGQDSGLFTGMHHPGWDGEFFTYMLGKLGASAAHLDPGKQGRCMVELFGAYGWAEGNRLCKWLADYMLVRGVNYFVPHAFDPAPFPDVDCPPHFYAHGHNPQFAEFPLLMRYLNRMSHVLAGQHIAPVAVLYHAEAEWSGEYMLTQKPAAVLAKHCMDYDIVPADALRADAARDGKLQLNGERFSALVLPYAEALPAALLTAVQAYLAAGVKVYCLDALPTRSCEGGAVPPLVGIQLVTLDTLPAALQADAVPELTLSHPQPYLRYYHARQADGDVYFFVNESPADPVDTVVTGAKPGPAFVYNGMQNRLYADAAAFTLHLAPGETRCVLVPDKAEALPATPATVLEAATAPAQTIPLAPGTVCFADAETGCKTFCAPQPLAAFAPLNQLPGYACFAGRIRYELSLPLSEPQAQRPARLVLSGVQEGAALTVNGKACGVCITAPYRFDVSGALQTGPNQVCIEVNTTLGRRMNDFLSQNLLVEPLGITEGVRLELF